MRFECDFCGRIITITEYEFALWSKNRHILCDKCKSNYEKGINETRKIK